MDNEELDRILGFDTLDFCEYPAALSPEKEWLEPLPLPYGGNGFNSHFDDITDVEMRDLETQFLNFRSTPEPPTFILPILDAEDVKPKKIKTRRPLEVLVSFAECLNEFEGASDPAPRKRRRLYSPNRLEVVNNVRKVGACARCRLLKKPVSSRSCLLWLCSRTDVGSVV